MKGDYNRLEMKCKELQYQKDGLEGGKDKQIKHLEEEIGYLKKHYEMELGLIKDENDILKRELQEIVPRRQMTHHTPN